MRVAPAARSRAKRLFDLACAATAGIVVLPVALLAGLAVWLSMGPPVLFRQARAGIGGRIFILYKFRTMTEARDLAGDLTASAERLTPLGRFLRATCIDELPQLANILRGEMSLVGPRPLLPEYVARYTPEQARRLEVRPGLTGWAQVNGRNALSWEEKFRLDVWYVDNWSLALDLRIVLATLPKVLSREGVSAPGYETMPEFMGSHAEPSKLESPDRTSKG
ncbi:MAG: sugar transferase [bacterium]|nr:sugar transferase [bacterium]